MKYLVNPIDAPLEPTISFDTEYTEKNVRRASLLSMSIGVSPELTYIFDTDHIMHAKRLLDYVGRIYTWNGVVDWYMMLKNSIVVSPTLIWDAMLMEHLVDERLDHGLGDFAIRECNDN